MEVIYFCFKIVENYKKRTVKIQPLIKSLLISNEKISIPNLGSFISKYKSAEIDNKTGEITSPTKEIFFDESLKEDDGILVSALMSLNLSEKDAIKEIDHFRTSILKKIDFNSKFEIEDLGSFNRNDKKEIVFISTLKDFILPENIGMSSLSFAEDELVTTKLSKNNLKKEKRKKTKTPKKPKEKKIIEKAPEISKDKKIKDKQKSKRLAKTLLIIIPIIAILVLLGVFHKPIIEKGQDLWSQMKDTTKNEIIVDENTSENDTVEINNDDTIDEFGNDEEYRELLNSGISSTAEVDLGNDYKKFYIIVGSFSVKEYADKYKDELVVQGFAAAVIDGSEYYRVSISGFDKADDLITTYNNMKSKYGDNIWILINR